MVMSVYKDDDLKSAVQERIGILKKTGYLGYKIVKTDRKWEGCEVMARSLEGKVLTAEGESIEEAYGNLVKRIDQVSGD